MLHIYIVLLLFVLMSLIALCNSNSSSRKLSLERKRERRESIKVDFTTNDYRFVSCDDDDAMLLGTDNRFNRISRSERKIAL